MKLQLYANAVQAFIDPEADLEDVESMCASLIDQVRALQPCSWPFEPLCPRLTSLTFPSS